MFNIYYITTDYEEPIFFSIITINKTEETSLYIGKKLVRRKSLQEGFHILKKDNIELRLQIKLLKVLPELYIDNKKIEIQKQKRNEIQKILNDFNIYNDINPKKKPKQTFQYKKLKTPIILLFLGGLWQITMEKHGKFWEIPSIILFMTAYYQLFSPLIDKIPERYLDEETKGKFKLISGFIFMIITQIIIDKLIN